MSIACTDAWGKLKFPAMKKLSLFLLLATSLFAATPKKPKLVVAIIVDQFRYDYLTRFRSEYNSGLDRLLTKGAVFTNAQLIHFPSITAVGHSTFLTGAPPSMSGIIGNEWYDREERKKVTSVQDPKTRQLGGVAGTQGASPRRMLVDTVGDELKMAHPGKSHVVGVSLKDRAAILPAGHMADGAYWFDAASGNFVSSDFYFQDQPAWVKEFNAARNGEKYSGRTWLNHTLPTTAKEIYGTDDKSPLESSPFGNELVELFAEKALVSEQLGKHEATDLLAVSFSSNDKVGHEYGMYSPEAHAMSIETDKILGKLFAALEKQVGMDNVLVVLSADHGVAPSPKDDEANRMPGGRMPASSVREAVQAALVKKYGERAWISYSGDTGLYFDYTLAASHNVDIAELTRVAARAAAGVAHVARVFTHEQILAGALPRNDLGHRIVNGANARRGPDLVVILDPYWVTGSALGNHGAPYSYDTHIPLLFLGAGIRAGRYDAAAALNDVAPTLATILDVETPSGSIGRVLSEMFVP